MDDPHEAPPHSSETKNVLPDVVHSQQIVSSGTVVGDETDAAHIDTGQNIVGESVGSHHVENTSETESISEHILSKMDYSVTESENETKTHESNNLLKVQADQDNISKHSSLNIPFPHSPVSDDPSTLDPSKQSTSWALDVNAVSDIQLLSDESPVNLPLSSDASRHLDKSHCLTKQSSENKSPKESASPQSGDHETLKESPRSDVYLDSLNEEASHQSNISVGDDISLEKTSNSSLGKPNSATDKGVESPNKSSGSEEIIKLDIRGSGVPKFPLQAAKIIFGPPPEGSTVIGGNVEQIPVFQNLLSPFLVGAGDSIKIEEVFDDVSKDPSPSRSPELLQSKEQSPELASDLSPDKDSLSSDKEQDVLVEELTVDHDVKEPESYKPDEPSIPTQPKSMAPEEMSFSTMTTDYKTICEEYNEKLVHLEAAITKRDELIEELTVSLQQSVQERDQLRTENVHLTGEVQNLQHIVAEHSEHDTVKAQLSDFIKYETMVKDESTRFYSALMSGGSSLKSSNGEKDNDHEEITVNYSRSDLKSSECSDDFQTGFEQKVTTIMNKFEDCIEENLRNQLRESIIQVLCNEIGKMRIESDTEMKELETQMSQDKLAYSVDTRRLRELLASVKAGNVDIDALRQELSVKHEKEMENLRTYFEKKCSDMERSYSEEVWRGRACASPGSASPEAGAAGDCRRRTRSADLPSLTQESTQLEHAVKQASKKYETQLEDMRAEHLAYVSELLTKHREAVGALEEQIAQLRAHIQSAESADGNVSLYQQDIDLELEKEKDATLESRMDEVRQEVVQQLQEQIQVLLSDPDAEVSAWPLELVALRDKIHAHAEVSGAREELAAGEADKWRRRRNFSFDQNRQLEEVTKERDGLKRVAVTLQRVVSQLVAYCACAEDELNRTVLAQLLGRLHPHQTIFSGESRPASPGSAELDLSAVSRPERHVHFAPDLHSILTELDEEGLAACLQEQRDLSADIKRELEHSLRRLRHEAHELLALSARLAPAPEDKRESLMLEPPQMRITELVDELDARQASCDNCELHRKGMEDAMAECLQRENLLRSDLDGAMMKIAQLMTSSERMQSSDLIAEGYGTGQPPRALAARVARPRTASESHSGAVSLDGASPRHAARLARDVDALLRDRDDLQQQLEAANRQLRSTRQFVEEQAAERETERDEFARRLAELRDENSRLATRLQNSARILNEMHTLRVRTLRSDGRARDAHVEQLEAQTRDMNQIISELETRRASTDEELKAQVEKVLLLRDVIATLENQLEQKSNQESETLIQLQAMKETIDERDSKMRTLLGELEALRSERVDQSDVTCVKCGLEEDRYAELVERVKEQTRWLEDKIHRRTRRLERVHEVCSASCSEPSEDVSLRDQRNPHVEVKSPEASPSPRAEHLSELSGVWECLEAHSRAEDAALKRIADLEMQRNQLKDVAQEVRAERDVLQARMSEQALRISSLSARLQQQRHDAEALAQQAASQLCVQLHDAAAEVQRLKEELESRDKQLARVKQTLEDRDKSNTKDKVMILERELSSAQARTAQLEALARGLEADKLQLQASLRDQQRALAEREEQLQDILALKLDEEQRDEKSEVVEGKTSARTLSDIVSISDFDEQDLQMRKAELKAHNLSISGAPYETRDKTANKTLPPDVQRANMSSLNIDYGDHFDLTTCSPRADSLPAHLTSTQNKDVLKQFKRNVNETTVFGTAEKLGDSVKHSTAQKISDNCSMYPNRDVSDSKNINVEPKKINFSLEATQDTNKTQNDDFTPLRDLGITLDIKQENFPDILTQLKHEIKKSRTELDNCKSELKNAEEQLCEFPALKEEVEELKGLLENTMATMENDKKFYENQLENFSSNKKLLELRLTELTQEVNEKSKDLHLLKEDILRRENMILELAKEKRNVTNKLAELELKIEELQSRNGVLDKYENENRQLREKVSELQKLEQLVSEKNQQIDSLNQHLDRFDDLQRTLNDKTEEFENLKEAFEEKSNELFQMQDTVAALTSDLAKTNEEKNLLDTNNKELTIKLTKLEKEQENASLKLQTSESEIERMNSLNNELSSKIEDLKLLTDKLKDKETEIEILHEDINSYHEEIASLKEQVMMASRSPSPRNKSGEEKKSPDRRASSDKKQLVKIRKQISLLQHELDFNRKELNDKAFELAKAKLDVTELTNNLSQSTKHAADCGAESAALRRQTDELQSQQQQLQTEKQQLQEQLQMVLSRIKEESNIGELKAKLREKSQRCQELEIELQDLRELVDRLRQSPSRDTHIPSEDQKALVLSGTRSPTAELERALRDQLNYSHTLDEDIMEQILSASSDERDDIPRLALNTSKSSSSIHSSSSERLGRLRGENEKLQLQLDNLQARLRDKDALIAELNRVRDKLVGDWQSHKLRFEAERDNAERLQLLLQSHKETAQSLQNQDSNMIQILKKRLESSMQSELELQQKEQQLRAKLAQLERQPLGADAQQARGTQLHYEMENKERLQGELSVMKSKLDVERGRYAELQAVLDRTRLQAQTDLDTKNDQCNSLRIELAELKRLKHEAGVELVRAKDLLNIQSGTIAELDRKLGATRKQRPIDDALTEIESHKSELAREIATLKQCLLDARAPARAAAAGADEKDQAIRYLHGRCLRLESCRKALVWQKRYLQRVLSGYVELERNLRLPSKPAEASRGKRRFKCVATAVVVTLRMEFLVRRRRGARALSAACILRPGAAPPASAPHTPATQYKACPAAARRPESLARRLLGGEMRLNLQSSPGMGEFTRHSPYSASSPREDSFILSSPRGEVATGYLNKLELVSRCLNQAMDASRDVP